ncbi:MAG: hypothetical protein H6558_03535 [Lewinellaceae bacterium]|nr:hypothetical protein [Lewinellaceae bacterium]MCB9286699.1 hypothetical protein [Lewinellaceae bacterium]
MKTNILFFVFALFTFSSLQAQWNSLQGPAFSNTDPAARIGIGADTSQSKLHVRQASNENWAAHLENLGGFGRGLLIKAGYNGNDDVPVLRAESWNDGHPGLTVLSNGNVGIGARSPASKLTLKEVFEGNSSATAPESIVKFNKEFNHTGLGGYGRNTDVLHLEMDGGASNDNHFLECRNEGTVVASIDGLGNGVFTSLHADYLDITNWTPENLEIDNYINHNNDPNTYFGFPANDQFVIRAGGTDWLSIQDDGMFIPAYFKHDGDANTFFGFPASDQFKVRTGGYDRLKIVGGKVGIGNFSSSPTTTLHVGSGTDATLIENNSGYVLIGNASGTNLVIDDNEIMARNMNNIPEYSPLGLQAEGGEIRIHNQLSVDQKFIIQHNGQVGIGEENLGDYKLSVNGKVKCREVRVTNDGWSDFVFDEDYQLPSLEEVKAFIEENNHLPDVPSAQEVMENGTNLGEIDAILLQKIEELTLYVIDLKKENETLKERIGQLEE